MQKDWRSERHHNFWKLMMNKIKIIRGLLIAMLVGMSAADGNPKKFMEGFADSDTLIVSGDGVAEKDDKGGVPHEIIKAKALYTAKIDAYQKILQILNSPKNSGHTVAEGGLAGSAVASDLKFSGFLGAEVISQNVKPDGTAYGAKIWLKVHGSGLKSNGIQKITASRRTTKIRAEAVALVSGKEKNTAAKSVVASFCESLGQVAEWRHMNLAAAANVDNFALAGTAVGLDAKFQVVDVKVAFVATVENFAMAGYNIACESAGNWMVSNENFINGGYQFADTEVEKVFFEKLRTAKNLQYGSNWIIESVETSCTKTNCKTIMKSIWREN